MKNLTFTLLLLGMFSSLSAQFVTIPDAAFRNKLIQLYPSCFNASQQMDTTCSSIINTTVLDVSGLGISDLSGLQYFDRLQVLDCNGNIHRLFDNVIIPATLKTLYCDNNALRALPPLPSGLTRLRCTRNSFTSLSSLPAGLQHLDCSNTQLTSLPTLPSGLKTLTCNYNSVNNLSFLFPSTLPAGLTHLSCKGSLVPMLPTLPTTLKVLDCSATLLTSLPALPPNLDTLDCSFSNISALPTLPSSLLFLGCSSNRLTSLPSLPNRLVSIKCSENQLTSLPILPSSLTTIECYQNQLSALPSLPNSLRSLVCGNNLLTSLPSLPISLTALACNNNLLTSLLPLPNSLTELNCGNNQLTSLPSLPVSLTTLVCNNNQLTSLPPFPNSLTFLNCAYNQLTSLPSLPSGLMNLHVRDNPNLSCLPILPNRMSSISTRQSMMGSMWNTAITCLPNYPQNITQISSGLPLCTNPSQICQPSPMVQGIIFDDTNNNGVRGANENQIGGIPIVVTPNNWTDVSNNTNTYLVKLDILPVVNTITPGVIQYRSFSPSSYTVTTTNLGLLPTSYNFAMQSQPNVTDLVTSFCARAHRPGFQASTSLHVENIGTINQTNTRISIEIPNGLNVLSMSPANGVVNGNTVTWSGESIAIFERKHYTVSLQVPSTMTLGTNLTYTARATPANTDFTPTDNIVTQTVVVTGSYDPNDKQVNKDRLPNNYVAADEEMLYTIRFQNTGTDTAFTVLVRDTLDLQKLDFSTFRVTGASHALRTNVRDHGVVEFVFNNINLPDSFVNEPLSHGYVQFRIHPRANLPLGTQIKNRAFIYFDFNTPIITNFATTTVGLLSVSSAALGAGSLSLYPVPVAEQLMVNFYAVRSGEVRYRLLDLQGRLLQERQLSVVEGENISTMDMSQLGAGMYLLQVVGEQGSVSQKIIKE